MLSTIAGVGFLTGIVFHTYSSEAFLDYLLKWTFQSNLFAFTIACWYTFFPQSRIFNNNLILTVAGNNLYLAGFGFWLILMPIAFAGYPDYVIKSAGHSDFSGLEQTTFNVGINPNHIKELQSNLSMFYSFWNHFVTQFFYFLFMIQSFRSSTKKHLLPTSLSYLMKVSFIWLTFYCLIIVILVPFATNLYPVYGIFTNFNPWTSYKLADKKTLMYSSWIPSVTLLLIYASATLISFFNWRTAIQYNKITLQKYLEQID